MFALDEGRWSLRTLRQRRITARGVTPHGTTIAHTTTTWRYVAVDPTGGEGFWRILPRFNAALMQVFRAAFAAQCADTFNRLILDNSRAHTAARLRIPANPATVSLVFQPPYCSEVNPVERVWQDVRGTLV